MRIPDWLYREARTLDYSIVIGAVAIVALISIGAIK